MWQNVARLFLASTSNGGRVSGSSMVDSKTARTVRKARLLHRLYLIQGCQSWAPSAPARQFTCTDARLRMPSWQSR
ncbi:hypothetical protein M3J09_009838 [Ascochyta lentis]